MNELPILDFVLYNTGDVVIRKFKEKDTKAQVVHSTILVDSERYRYQVLFFESNPNSPNVATEFEPFNADEKKRYYEHLEGIRLKGKVKKVTKPTTSNTDKNKVLTFKLFKDD